MDGEAFDAIVVGAGQAGPAIAARCSREGLKTAVIERHLFGGTCLNVGCVPTKTLVASARAIRLAQRGADFGFDVGGPSCRASVARDGLQWAVDLQHACCCCIGGHGTDPNEQNTQQSPALGRSGALQPGHS